MARPLIFVSCGLTTTPLIPLLAPRFALVLPYPDKAERLRAQGIDAIGWDALADPATLAAVPERARQLARVGFARLERRADELFLFGGARRDALLPAIDTLLHRRLDGHLMALEFGR